MSEKIYNLVEIETIERLAALVADKKLEEITVTHGNDTITIKGRKCPPPPPVSSPAPPAAVVTAAAAAPAEPAPAEDVPAAAGTVIKAPIVGTFYAASAPDQPPFVQVGDSVKKGDVILIIESMKLMNEVTSDTDGVVKEILVQNGEAVEYDQPLMVIG